MHMDLFVSDGSFNRARMPLDALDEKMRLITSCTGFQRCCPIAKGTMDADSTSAMVG
jgi:hypothetical protein